MQALVRATAISPGQASGAQLDTAVPADNQDRDLIAILRVDGREYRPASGATGFAIITAAVLIPELPGPAIVRGIQVAVLLDKIEGLLGAGDGAA